MIELKFTGNTLEEVQEALFATANVIAQGRQLQNLAAAQAQARTQPAPPLKPEEPKADVQVEASRPKAGKAKKEPTPAAPTEPEVDSAEQNVESVETAQPVPSTIDELRALAMKAMDKIGNDKAKSILQKYAPKLADIPKDKIAECGKDFLKAMDAA